MGPDLVVPRARTNENGEVEGVPSTDGILFYPENHHIVLYGVGEKADMTMTVIWGVASVALDEMIESLHDKPVDVRDIVCNWRAESPTIGTS